MPDSLGMELFALFSMICFLFYIQAGIYIIWRNPFMGVNYLFSIMLFLFAIVSLAYVFSFMGETGRNLFPPARITLTVMLLAPAFYCRIGMSLLNYPKSQNLRDIVFTICFLTGLGLLLFINNNDSYDIYQGAVLLNHSLALLATGSVFFALNAFIFSRLQFYIHKPDIVSKDIVRQMNYIYILCDDHFLIRDANMYTADLSGHTKSDMIGKPLDEYILSDDLTAWLFNALENGSSEPLEASFNLAVNSHIPVRIECHRLKDHYNDIHGMVISGEELSDEVSMKSEIRKYEKTRIQLKQVSEQLQDMIGKYSHELADLHKQLYDHYASNHQEKILTGLQERDYLISEIHDRVIVNMRLALLIITIRSGKHATELLNSKLQQLSKRVHSILLVHEFLYFSINYSEVDFKGFLYKLVSELKTYYDKDNRICIGLNICDRYIDIQRAIALGIVANELIANCFIHAFQTSGVDAMIQVDFFEEAGYIHLIIKDNGVGFPESPNIHEYWSSGLKLVEILVKEQINGTIDFHVSQGCWVAVSIPDQVSVGH